MTSTRQQTPDQGSITAILGPTNTGKTHYGVERMLSRASGIIGLPLRLLAREIYDRIREIRGAAQVALITGEEKIQPAGARYFVCTAEAMPLEIDADFVAIDEIQLCADPERGHIFTDRLLHARGRYETLFLGSDNMRGRIASLVPRARFNGRERFSAPRCTTCRLRSRLAPLRSCFPSMRARSRCGIAAGQLSGKASIALASVRAIESWCPPMRAAQKLMLYCERDSTSRTIA